MSVRGVRGATTAQQNSPEAILSATRELLDAILEANPSLNTTDIASVLFTLTRDLQAAFPAKAARQMGWDHVPLLCAQEIPVPGDPEHCIRVLIHWNTTLPQSEIQHVYLKHARALRPDWGPADEPEASFQANHRRRTA